jgi:hypothetical protein
MQLHRKGDEFWLFSRNTVEHRQRSGYDVLDPMFKAQLRDEEVVLDGELVVYNFRLCAPLMHVPLK